MVSALENSQRVLTTATHDSCRISERITTCSFEEVYFRLNDYELTMKLEMMVQVRRGECAMTAFGTVTRNLSIQSDASVAQTEIFLQPPSRSLILCLVLHPYGQSSYSYLL